MGPADDDESLAAIRRAVELGVDWIDTAPGYGLGHSEVVVGRAVRELGADAPRVFTKCGFVWDDTGTVRVCLEPASLRKECEHSLRRLGVEAIDLYQIHWVEPEDDPLVEDAWSTLLALRDEGKVRHVGVSNFSVDQLERADRLGRVETLQPPYSLIDRSAEAELLPWCADNGRGVIVYSPLQSGLLSGAMTRERAEGLRPDDARQLDPQFQEPQLTRNLALAERVTEIANASGRAPGALAIAAVLDHAAVSGAIVGFRRPQQVEGLLAGGGLRLDDGERQSLRDALDALPAPS
jgi:aryl-alcohol dehydrogenase-like predicted oxidoreductase